MAQSKSNELDVKVRGKKNYKVVQLSEEMHAILKDYCNERGIIMSSFVTALIKRELNKK